MALLIDLHVKRVSHWTATNQN